MSHVTALGYVRITAQDLDAFDGFAQQVLGFQRTHIGAADDATTLYFRSDERSWRFAVEQGSDGGCAALGWEVRDAAALRAVKRALEAAGVSVKESPELAAERMVCGLLQATDPAGFPLEIYYGLQSDKLPFVSPVGTRFVTGEMGVGHVGLHVGNVAEEAGFYTDVLGFGTSDVIDLVVTLTDFGITPAKRGDEGAMTIHARFLHCNPRHHTLAFVAFPGMDADLGHVMLQVEDIDMVGRAMEGLYNRGSAPATSLGRHSNDHMISFYLDSPSGLRFEYGWGARQVDVGQWTTGRYDVASLWGHRPNMPAAS